MHASPSALVRTLVSWFAHQHTWTEEVTATIVCADQPCTVTVRACPCGVDDFHIALVTDNVRYPTRISQPAVG